jgi:hypothetical protein
MLGNPKALKRNDRECKGILIGPSMAPRFSQCRDSVAVFFSRSRRVAVGFGVKFRGADGKPTTEPFVRNESRVGWIWDPQPS